ncbi:MAG: hypothetical protein LBD79_11000 [Treponema sp.]|nr:hypothetical protein [Treponema sp.]
MLVVVGEAMSFAPFVAVYYLIRVGMGEAIIKGAYIAQLGWTVCGEAVAVQLCSVDVFVHGGVWDALGDQGGVCPAFGCVTTGVSYGELQGKGGGREYREAGGVYRASVVRFGGVFFNQTIKDYGAFCVAYTKEFDVSFALFLLILNNTYHFLLLGIILLSGGVANYGMMDYGAFAFTAVFYLIFLVSLPTSFVKLMYVSQNGLLIVNSIERVDAALASSTLQSLWLFRFPL